MQQAHFDELLATAKTEYEKARRKARDEQTQNQQRGANQRNRYLTLNMVLNPWDGHIATEEMADIRHQLKCELEIHARAFEFQLAQERPRKGQQSFEFELPSKSA